jgi:3-oxoadipate enol-lactonase
MREGKIMESQLEGLILERKGCPIHYWVGGPEGRPLVVLTHGACVDHRSFEPLVPALAKEYRVLNWDVRGHGLSQPMGKPFSTPLAVEDLLAILDKLGYQKAVFIGHSNGTYISQEVAYRHPERVQAMVLADGTCITWPRSAFEKWIIRASSGIMNFLPYETLKTMSLPMFSARKDVQDYIYEAFSMLTKPQFIALWNGVISCLHEDPEYKIIQPVMLVLGENDRTGDMKKIYPLWAKQLPNCQFEIIPDASHFAILDNPEYINRLVLSFLAKWAPV